MAEIPVEAGKDGGKLETWVGISVVLLATFLGVCNIKGNNIAQKMQLKQADRIDNWAWFQARNVRHAIYEAAADELSVPWPGETPEARQIREAKAEAYRKRAREQEEKGEKQKADAEAAMREYEALGEQDDQFDLSEAALSLGLAMMGLTVLLKRWWLFWVALVPAGIGVVMGVAGFLGASTSSPIIKNVVGFLS